MKNTINQEIIATIKILNFKKIFKDLCPYNRWKFWFNCSRYLHFKISIKKEDQYPCDKVLQFS